jgi:hypothetical protein
MDETAPADFTASLQKASESSIAQVSGMGLELKQRNQVFCL